MNRIAKNVNAKSAIHENAKFPKYILDNGKQVVKAIELTIDLLAPASLASLSSSIRHETIQNLQNVFKSIQDKFWRLAKVQVLKVLSCKNK